jgi:hypothetical protein
MKPLEGVFLVIWQSGKPVDRAIDGVGTFTQRMAGDITFPGDRYPRAVVLEDLDFRPPGQRQGPDWDKIKGEHPSAGLQPPANGRRFTVAVRGTNNWADKLRDVQLWKDTPSWAMGQKLHHGFADAAEAIAKEVLKVLEGESAKRPIDKELTEIRITGHSLGTYGLRSACHFCSLITSNGCRYAAAVLILVMPCITVNAAEQGWSMPQSVRLLTCVALIPTQPARGTWRHACIVGYLPHMMHMLSASS